MNFGDWPAWIALASAIASPVVTVYLNNRHAEKMAHYQTKKDASIAISTLTTEINSSLNTPLADFNGFSAAALSALSFCDEETVSLFIDGLGEIQDNVFKHRINTINSRGIVYMSTLVLENIRINDQKRESCTYTSWCHEMTKRLTMCQSTVLQKESLLLKALKQFQHSRAH